jgi:signal transduction histidine kinase
VVEGIEASADDDCMQGPRVMPPVHAASALGRACVVVASGDAALQDEIARALGDRYDVVCVVDRASALQAVHAMHADLVLADAAISRKGEAPLLAVLRGDPRTHVIPVIVLAAASSDAADDAWPSPDDRLIWPFGAAELASRVDALLLRSHAQRSWTIEQRSAEREFVRTDHAEHAERVRRFQESAAWAQVEARELSLEPLDLTALARGIVAELSAHESSRVVDVQVSDGMTAIGDRALVTRLLEELLGNAWEFTRSRTPAVIIAERQRPGVFVIRDNGVGFDAADSERLFQPFHRLATSAESPGVGVGLAIVRRIVERHGGDAWAHGIVNGGATFWFTLGPASEPPPSDESAS